MASERVKHSGPDTKFCVLCLSGEHERVEDDAPDAGEDLTDSSDRSDHLLK